MKAVRLTWLHSCLLGGRRHDYRGAAPPAFASVDQHAFQGGRMRWEGRLGQLLLLFCWWCCFLYTGLPTLQQVLPAQPVRPFIGVCCFQDTRLCISELQQCWTWTLEVSPQVLLWISRSLTLGSLHLSDLCSEVNLVISGQSPLRSKLTVKNVSWKKNAASSAC